MKLALKIVLFIGATGGWAFLILAVILSLAAEDEFSTPRQVRSL